MSDNFVFAPARQAALNVSGSERLFPVHRVYCVGQNYAAHASEMGESGRKPPFFFSKPADAVTHSPRVNFPPETARLHHEVELVVAMGRACSSITAHEALDHVFGYAVGVDLTRRDLQELAKAQRRPWDVSKGFDESAPVSPIVRVSDSGHPFDARIWLSVDGELKQQGSTAHMIWPVAELIAELSRYFALLPGDLIFTGTPEGVGPLPPGCQVTCEVQGLARHSFRMSEGSSG